MQFNSAELGFLRIAVASPAVTVGDVTGNLVTIHAAIEDAQVEGARLLVLPELCLTGYSCADTFYHETLLEAAWNALVELCDASEERNLAVVVGLPVAVDGRLFNCAAMVCGGEIVGIVPKTYLPNTNEFYEARWFRPASDAQSDIIEVGGYEVPFGNDLLFRLKAPAGPDCLIGIEICEDLWTVQPPSGAMAVAGASVILNPSNSPEILGKAAYRRSLVQAQSARCLAAYAYAGAGPGESTTDVVSSGHSMIAEYGNILTETRRFRFDTQIAVADVDIGRLYAERLRSSSFGGAQTQRTFRELSLEFAPAQESMSAADLRRQVDAHPFVPQPEQRGEVCSEIFAIQTTALTKRMRHIGSASLVLGVSGGLDSTLALLVAARAFDRMRRGRRHILAVTMPGFGTTERTKSNAVELARELGVELREIDIRDAVRQHFRDIGHDEKRHDITFENAQARERTQILMDLANMEGGIVLGTGDLSELALGWSTYNADHMSMYNVNCGVPKTLVRTVVEWCADEVFEGRVSEILHDICDTPVSPELLPADAHGNPQSTEGTIGPYELHDFFLYHFHRHHVRPRKLCALALKAFGDQYSYNDILDTMEVFHRRFFSQQFKRSALPDGPKVGTIALSPRGDWRMPSDTVAAIWLEEITQVRRELQEANSRW